MGSGLTEEKAYITVAEGQKIALAAGFTMSRPTVLKLFKDSRAVKRLGGRFFMPRQDFMQLLYGENDAADKGQNNAGNSADDQTA